MSIQSRSFGRRPPRTSSPRLKKPKPPYAGSSEPNVRVGTLECARCFGRPARRIRPPRFLDRLLGPERRKTGWMRAEAAGDKGPWRQQAVLGRNHWDADAL